MSESKPVVMGVAGMGGFAATIANLVMNSGPGTDPPVRLAVVCDPDPSGHDGRDQELASRGAEVFDSYEKLLAHDEVEAVWLPVPIDLHRPFTEAALAAGKPVIVEKPVAGCVDDVDAMIAARDRAGLPVAVGFHDVYDKTTMPLKRRILAGEFGAMKSVTLAACWPRADSYFARSNWAGRFKRNGVWVMDSPANNALAHYINIALFLLGPTEFESASPEHVEAELYRAADIENYDTVSMRLIVPGGATLLVLLTHACGATHHPALLLEGEKGAVRWTTDPKAVKARYGNGLEIVAAEYNSRVQMLERLARMVRGIDDPDAAISTLESARCHTVAINGASEATPVISVPESAINQVKVGAGHVRAIEGIEDVIHACASEGQMLHESGVLGFTQPAGTLDLRGYDHFAGPRMAGADDARATALA